MGRETSEAHIEPVDIASYAWPPGERQRYTEAGWEKAITLGIARITREQLLADPTLCERLAGIVVDPELAKKYPIVGDVRRYGAVCEEPTKGEDNGAPGRFSAHAPWCAARFRANSEDSNCAARTGQRTEGYEPAR